MERRDRSNQKIVTLKVENSPPNVEDNGREQDLSAESCDEQRQDDEVCDESTEPSEDKVPSHQQAMEYFKDALAEIVVGDQLLSDLHTEVTLEEVKSQIALEHGKAITINIRRGDDIILPVVIVQNATVLDLKKAIERHVVLRQARDCGIKHISWRYVWRSYWLYFNAQKLAEDSKLIKDYGISNRDEITFVKRLRPK